MARIFQDTKEKRELGNKALWWVEWRDNGRRRSQKVGTKKQAKDIAALKDSERLQRRNGLAIDKLWADFVKEYSDTELPKMRSIHSRALVTEALSIIARKYGPNPSFSQTLTRTAIHFGLLSSPDEWPQ